MYRSIAAVSFNFTDHSEAFGRNVPSLRETSFLYPQGSTVFKSMEVADLFGISVSYFHTTRCHVSENTGCERNNSHISKGNYKQMVRGITKNFLFPKC
jgi:hypothetical protein